MSQCWLRESVRFGDIHLRAFSKEIPLPSIITVSLKITCLKFHPNHTGAYELTSFSVSGGVDTLSSWLILTHWGRVTHIWVGKLTIIDSDNGLSPGRRQAIIWTNAGILLIGPLRTNFSEILIGIQTFSLRKMHLKILSAKWRPFCLGLNVLTTGIASCDAENNPKTKTNSFLKQNITCDWRVYFRYIHLQLFTSNDTMKTETRDKHLP